MFIKSDFFYNFILCHLHYIIPYTFLCILLYFISNEKNLILSTCFVCLNFLAQK